MLKSILYINASSQLLIVELIDSYNKGEIDKETFDYCYKIAEKLMNELTKGNNRFVNRGLKDYLKMKEE